MPDGSVTKGGACLADRGEAIRAVQTSQHMVLTQTLENTPQLRNTKELKRSCLTEGFLSVWGAIAALKEWETWVDVELFGHLGPCVTCSQ